MPTEIRKKIVQHFQYEGILLDKEALDTLEEYVSGAPDKEDAVSTLSDAREAVAEDTAKITKDVAVRIVDRLLYGHRFDVIQVISAFDVPNIKYDPIRKAFFKSDSERGMLGDAKDEIEMYLQRFYLLQQSLARNPNFNRPVLDNLSTTTTIELTEVKSLMGQYGKRRTLFGFVNKAGDEYILEDLSGCIKVDVSEAKTAGGLFVENCVVAAEGYLEHNGKFKVELMGMPPNEKREDSIAAAKGLDFFGGVLPKGGDRVKCEEWEVLHSEDRIVFLSDIWLDSSKCIASLNEMLEVYDCLDQVPALFVLIGNFHSFSCTSAATDLVAIRQDFASLGRILSRHSRIMESSRYLFVPGPEDPGLATVLPRPPLPSTLTTELRDALPNAIFGTNPCRVRYCNKEIVIFRDDMQKLMRRAYLLHPKEGSRDGAAGSTFDDLAMTVTQQLHLCPLPLKKQNRPALLIQKLPVKQSKQGSDDCVMVTLAVCWQLDNALRLYPVPDVVVLADSAAAGDYINKKCRCVCINPGSMHSGTFAAYRPSMHEAELCDVPDMTETVS